MEEKNSDATLHFFKDDGEACDMSPVMSSHVEEPILKDDVLMSLNSPRKRSDSDDFAKLVTETLEEAQKKPKY